jgi:hypothetical protein
MNRIPKLIDWSKLSSLDTGMRKQASTMEGNNKPVNREATDSRGKTHKPKEGFSGPHLKSSGVVYYIKDGQEWCPYQKAFISNKAASLDEAIKTAMSSRSIIDEISDNPNILSDFCSHYGYHGEPIGCLRAAFSAANPVIRKFAMLAAFDAEERIIKKKADFGDGVSKIIPDNTNNTKLDWEEVARIVRPFVAKAVSDADTKDIYTITSIMKDRARKSNENIIVEIIDSFLEHVSEYRLYLEMKNSDAISSLIDSFSAYLGEKYVFVKKALKKERVGEEVKGEWTDNIAGIGGIEDRSKSSPLGIGKDFFGKPITDTGYTESNTAEDLTKEAKKKKSKKSGKGKSIPTNPSLWKSCLAWAKRTYDVCPSAYCNGAAAKRYKSKGGKWKKGKK